ncbi:MAG: 5' nucleotidase, NT5C type [Erysipelotrichaceae bacterium]
MKLRSKNNRPRLLFDMDDVITNFLGSVVDIYNMRKGTQYTIHEVRSWDLNGPFDADIFDIFREEGFFLQLEEKNNATGVLKSLIDSSRYDVYIITACNTATELMEKVQWMEKVLPSFNQSRIIACKEKHIIRGDMIIDDKVENLEACAPFMECILYDMPHNQDCEQFTRIHNLNQLLPILEERFYNS